ncbi:hypothetical protein [Aquabacterium sp.]|uniref:hypothetical protein n=1 Tax=Aquabacterium sp. TaxID=1872578 RepID=UPI0025C1D9BC|nr:hypothetical protein [Aquabacterium sp.]
MSPTPSRAHLTRLMKIWRSAGWPSRDPIDIDLLAAGWVSLVGEHPAQQCLKLTDEGIALLGQSRQAQRRAHSSHDRLALRMADHLMASGRLVWRELSLRAQIEGQASTDIPPILASEGLWADAQPSPTPAQALASAQWRLSRPDLFSVRRTSNPAYLQAMVHEVKVSRADLFSDLRNKAKRAAYQWLCSECHYVFPAGLAEPKELPEELGVWVVHGDIERGQLELLRPARHQPCTLPFDVWMAMAQATPVQAALAPTQAELTEVQEQDAA